MTPKEPTTIKELKRSIDARFESNREFSKELQDKIESIEQKLDKKHIPANLEGDILKIAQQSVAEAIKSALTGYGSPLTKLVLEVVEGDKTFLKGIISESFDKVIKTEEFKASIVAAFSHKVAKSIISNNDGLFDKVSNELKQDAVFKAKMSLAVSRVVEECLRGNE